MSGPTPMDAQANLVAQIAVVTGASRGIGRTIALHLASRGAKIVALARDQQELDKTCDEIHHHGGVGVAIRADVTCESDVESAMAKAENDLGPVTLLVNNAGRGHSIGPIWEIDANDWWSDVEVNLRGTFLCAREALKGMTARRQGRIINVSSAAGNMTLPMVSSYACAKAAVQRLTDCLAAAVKAYGISVFAISPGPTRTAMTKNILESPEGRKWIPELQSLPERAWTDPVAIGRLVATLASGQADILSGRFIHLHQNLGELLLRGEEIQSKDLYTLRLRE